MQERKKTHLIYMDESGYTWMQEHGVGAKHPDQALSYANVPSNDDKRWIDGKPQEVNEQFLTLSPFYPSQRLDVSVEINREPKIMRYVNHPAFDGCVKYMKIDTLDFKPIPKHIPLAIHTIGVCHYNHKEPYKTIDIAHDDKMIAIQEARKILAPTTVEHLKYEGCRPNEEYHKNYAKNPKKKM